MLACASATRITWHFIAPGKPMQNGVRASTAGCGMSCSTKACSSRYAIESMFSGLNDLVEQKRFPEMRHWLRAIVITAGLFAAWFALGVLAFDDDPRIDRLIDVGR
jgi:hypothetical protein